MRAAARRPAKAHDHATDPRGTGYQDYVPRAGCPDALPPLHAHRASWSYGQLLAVRLFRGGRDRRGGTGGGRLRTRASHTVGAVNAKPEVNGEVTPPGAPADGRPVDAPRPS